METLDLKKTLKHLYSPSVKQPQTITVPPLPCLMIDGAGDPNTAQAYKDAVGALYSAAYTLKFAFKKQRSVDYPVMPLEGLWWTDDMALFITADKSNWRWTMLIVQPEVVTEADVAQTVAELKVKKPSPALDLIRWAVFDEGAAAQIMYIGPYSAEAPTIARLHEYIAAQGYALSGKHHEIYLSDPNRSAPEKLKTIIRQPIRAKS
ncbi:MAG: GyrI-like domain-containing protein [Anaerolineae bacterium]|nr:GyrI-like domain-containing protein [Anaerolineae bacterium]